VTIGHSSLDVKPTVGFCGRSPAEGAMRIRSKEPSENRIVNLPPLALQGALVSKQTLISVFKRTRGTESILEKRSCTVDLQIVLFHRTASCTCCQTGVRESICLLSTGNLQLPSTRKNTHT